MSEPVDPEYEAACRSAEGLRSLLGKAPGIVGVEAQHGKLMCELQVIVTGITEEEARRYVPRYFRGLFVAVKQQKN